MGLIATTKKFQETANIIGLVRQRFGEEVPSSTVTGGLSVLKEAHLLRRFDSPNKTTSIYGLPEWFDDNGPKQEYFENTKPESNKVTTLAMLPHQDRMRRTINHP